MEPLKPTIKKIEAPALVKNPRVAAASISFITPAVLRDIVWNNAALCYTIAGVSTAVKSVLFIGVMQL